MVFAKRGRVFLEPLFYIAVGHIVYFSLPLNNTDQNNTVALAHLGASAGLLLGYYTLKVMLPTRRDIERLVIDNPAVQRTFLIICLSVSIWAPALAVFQGYSVFDVLTRFYARGEYGGGLTRVPWYVAYLGSGFGHLPMLGICLGRIWLNFRNDYLTKFLWLTLLTVHSLLTFSSGVRSGLLFLYLVLFLAEVYSTQTFRNRDAFSRRLGKYVRYGLGALLITVAISFLSEYRYTRFTSFASLWQAVTMSVRASAADEKSGFTEAVRQNLNESVAFTLEHFGNGEELPYGYSFYAAICNIVPRELWEHKPVGFGKVLAHRITGGSAPMEIQGFSAAAGLGGEGYANFGAPGPIIAGIMMSLLLYLLFRSLLQTNDLMTVGLCLLAFSWITGWYRGDWLNVNVVFYQWVTAYVIFRTLRFFSPVCFVSVK